MHDYQQQQACLARCLKTPLGDYLWHAETGFFRQYSRMPTERVLQLGQAQWCLRSVATAAQTYWCQHWQPHPQADVCAWPWAGPWPEYSFEQLWLPHTLDGCEADLAAQVLQSAAHALQPQGRLLLTALNPAGYWRLGCWQAAATLALHRTGQMRQLLADAGLSVAAGCFLGYGAYWRQRVYAPQALEYMGNRWWPHWAAVYGLVAVKEVAGWTPDAQLAQRLRQQAAWDLAPAGRQTSLR